MQKIIIFDYDDTLVIAKEWHLKILENIYGDKFIPYKDELLKQLPMAKEDLHRFLGEKNCEEGSFVEFCERFDSHKPDNTELFPWVKPILNKLKAESFDIVICSSNTLGNIESNLKRHRIKHYFKFLYTPTNGFDKDQDDIVSHIGRKYKTQKLQAVLVGDSLQDQRLANNSGVNYIDVKVFNGLSDDQIASTLISSAGAVFITSKNTKIQDNLIQSQYIALRQELQNLQEAEEKIYSTTLLATGTIFTGLLTIIFTKSVSIFPGLAFVFPAFYSLTSKAKYMINGLRVANISAYIAEVYKSFLPTQYNWEAKLTQFVQNEDVKKEVNLASPLETSFVYDLIIYVSLGAASAVSIFSFWKHFLDYAHRNFCVHKSFIDFNEIFDHLSVNAYAYLSLADILLVGFSVFWCIKTDQRKLKDPRTKIPFKIRGALFQNLWRNLD